MGTADQGSWQSDSDRATEATEWIFDNFRLIVLLTILVVEIGFAAVIA